MPDDSGRLEYRTATIAINASLSDAIGSRGLLLAGIIMPSAWTAANLTFQVSHDDTTYNNVYDSSGVEKQVTASASRYIILDPSEWSGAQFIKVRSGTSGSAVTQAAARSVILAFRSAS